MSTNYKATIEKSAAKFLKIQTRKQQERILKAIYTLPKGDTKLLQGYDNLYRLKVGSYRIIYRVDHIGGVINILKMGNRGEIYKVL